MIATIRRSIAGALLLLAALPHGAAGEVLRVGTSGDYPPFSAAGEGFDVDVARRFARDSGLSIEWVPFRWPELSTRVRDGSFDVAMSGVTWRPERSVVGWMTRSVAVGGPCLVGNPAPKSLAVNRGGILEPWARSSFPQARVLAVDDNLSLPDWLADGSVDAFVTDRFEVRSFARPGWSIRCEPPRDRKVYWVAPTRAEDLGPRLDRWIADNERVIDALRTRWFGAPAPRDEADHLVDLIGRRLELMPAVAEAKRQDGLALEDRERERVVLDAVRRRAKRAGLPPDRAIRLYATLIRLAKEVQRRSPSGPELDLAAELRPAILQLDERIIAALGRARTLGAEDRDRLEVLKVSLDPGEIRSITQALAPSAGEPGSDDLALGTSGISLSAEETSTVRLGGGVFDPLRIGGSKHRPGTTFAGHVDVRPGPKLFYVAPSVGLFASGKGSLYGYFAASVDVAFGPVRFTPTLGLGAYEEGEGKDLGGVFEFLVAGSATIPLPGGWRVGLSYAHLSNSNLHEDNPGTEMILGIVDIPLFR